MPDRIPSGPVSCCVCYWFGNHFRALRPSSHRVGIGSSWEIYIIRWPREIFVPDTERARTSNIPLFWTLAGLNRRAQETQKIFAHKNSFIVLHPNFLHRTIKLFATHIIYFWFDQSINSPLLLKNTLCADGTLSAIHLPQCRAHFRLHLFTCEVAPKRKTNTHHSQSTSLFKQGPLL